MKDISLKSIIEELPIGVVCLEIIKEDGQPVDYLVVDVNKDFVILTERLKEDMIGRRMSQIMPASLDETLELKGFLNEVMIDGTKKVTEQFIAAVKKLYRITAYQSDEKHIIINFKDVSDEMLNMEGLDHYFDIKNDLMCITDIDGNFIKVNHTWEDIMGYSTEELENKPYYNYLHPEDIDITKQELDKLHTNAKIINFINRYRCKDKTYRYLEWRCKLNHNIIYAVARDVTDSKNIESQLQNKTILLNQLLDSIPDIITYKDKDGNYLGCNQEFSKYIGMREEEIIGKNDYQLFTKEIADHNIRFDNLVINENKTAHHQEELIYTDKTKIQVDKIKAPLYLDNKCIGVISISRDITKRKEISDKLMAMEVNFGNFFDTVKEMIYITDSQGKIIFANTALREMLGYSRKEMSWINIFDITSVDQREEVEQVQREIYDKKRMVSTIPLVRKDGTYIPAENRIWIGKWNNTDCIFYASQDLSKEQESLQKFNKVFQHNPALMAIITTIDRIFTEVNEAFLIKTGYQREEVIGKSVAELKLFELTDKQVRIIDELSGRKSIYNEEVKMRIKSGELLIGLFSGEVIESNGTDYFLTVMVDITNQKIAEETMIYQSGMQRLLMNISTELINAPISQVLNIINRSLSDISEFLLADNAYTYDVSGDIAFKVIEWHRDTDNERLNKKHFLMEAYDDWRRNNQHCNMIMVVDSEELPDTNSLKNYLIENKIKSFITFPITSDNECVGFVSFEYITCIHRFSEVEITLLTIYSQILSNIKTRILQEQLLTNAKEEAEKANVAKSRFLANMSHEIRTPMNGIVGFLQLLEMNETNKDKIEYINNIKISTDNLLSLINDILDVSKIEAGKMELESIPFDLYGAVESAVIPFAARARLKGIDLNVLIHQEVPKFAVGDSTRIRQVISNLVGNAIKFTEHGSIFVEVALLREEENIDIVSCSVKDTGIGMSKAVIDKIFNPFTQADSSSTRKYGGTGLGLAICKSIVQMIGGNITIESEEGHGSKITFTMKLAQTDIIPMKLEMDYSILKDKKVLIVDDNAMNREIAKLYLQEVQCVVTEADNAAEALSNVIRMTEDKYDTILVDYSMQGLSGYDFAVTLSNIPFAKEIPLILLTSVVIKGGAEKARENGFAGFITKPYKRDELLKCMTMVMGGISEAEEKLKLSMKESEINPLKALHILIVDDSELNREFVIRYLRMKGIQCEIAVNGREAVKAYSEKKFDVVLMDCQMPILDGYQATGEIRAIEQGVTHIPIIAMTANAMLGDADKCLQSGMDDYISKPVNLEELTKLIMKYSPYKDTTINYSVDTKVQSPETKEETAISLEDIEKVASKPSILLVDDEPINLMLLEKALETEYNIRIASSGKEAIASATENPPDIILLDIMMPEMDGYEVCLRLREIPETKEVPIIFLTALEGEKNEEYAFQLGVVDYITKPFSILSIMGRIKNQIEIKRNRDLERENTYIDELTQIANRRKYNETILVEWNKAKAAEEYLSVLMIDFDLFKKYNDYYGHLKGDECLVKIAHKIKDILQRSTDLAVRWGGEEFVCILPNTDNSGASYIAEKLRYGIENLGIPHEKSDVSSFATVSIGIATMTPTSTFTLEEFQQQVDTALYNAKKAGRNCVRSASDLK